MTSHTCLLTPVQVDVLRVVLEEQDFEFSDRPHALFSARKGKVQVTVYAKGPKVLIQGKDTADFVQFTLEPRVIGEARMGYEEVLDPGQFQPHFGIDESGKGDYFGPLVIAGVYTDATTARHLIDAGIMDSKRISSDARIRKLAAIIRETPGCLHSIVSIGPERYNQMHAEFRNLNALLAWGHARVIENLLGQRPDCPRALSDQFANPRVLETALKRRKLTIQLDQRTKGESDVAVAAASILARERFIDWIDKTGKASGITLPLGASAAVIEAAKALVSTHGRDALPKVAKMHFRTTAEVLGPDPGSGGEAEGEVNS